MLGDSQSAPLPRSPPELHFRSGACIGGESLTQELPPAEFSQCTGHSSVTVFARTGARVADVVEGYARTDVRVWCLGTVASTILRAADSPGLDHRREWALNEKRSDERAGQRQAEVLISGVNNRSST